MGRYLAIGITIDLSFEKKKEAREFASLEAGVKYVEEHYFTTKRNTMNMSRTS